ncbi:chaplin, partial [Streptomyces sp. NPDC048420]|uniref:chaplin n=1 Tax=Streptomyces sp. NPDC048420 TaxID=3155755 RepID=UPI003438986D
MGSPFGAKAGFPLLKQEDNEKVRQTLSRGTIVAAAAATSILSLYTTAAFADSDAAGATETSPGVLSGNNVQAPVSIPVNVCGNSVDAIGVLNPAFGNSCANGDSGNTMLDTVPQQAAASGESSDSPGVLSGNNVQAPVSIPVNACGNSVDAIGVLNPAFGNSCANGDSGNTMLDTV